MPARMYYDNDADAAIAQALEKGNYILQAKVTLGLWAEEMAEIDHAARRIVLARRQTDFRCLVGPDRVFGFLCRFGDVPTNVGSGGGVQPLTVLKSDMTVKEAVDRINDAIADIFRQDLFDRDTLEEVARRDPGYFDWMIGSDFPAEVKQIAREAKMGKFPSKA